MKIRNNSLNRRCIDIDISPEISIHLYKKEYDNLIELLIPEMKEEIKTAYRIEKKAEQRKIECFNLINDIRNVFYSTYPDSEFCFAKDLNEINIDELSNILKKYNELLGLI